MIDWSRMRGSLATLLGKPGDPPTESAYKPVTASLPDDNADHSLSSETTAQPSWWRTKWEARQAARAERDVLVKYRASYGQDAQFRWWQRLRAGSGLISVVILLGLGLTVVVGMFFFGLTILLETVAS